MPQGEPVVFDAARRSYAFLWKNALPKDACGYAYDTLMKEAPWKELLSKNGLPTRKTCWVAGIGGSKCSCNYVYGETAMEPLRVPFLDRLTDVIFSLLFPDLPKEQHPNCANFNLYEAGHHSCGWHADDEPIFGDGETDVTIVSLSLGETREFWMALRRHGPGDATPDEHSIVEMDLADGDILTMEGKCQKHTLHMLPRAYCDEPRINITWRWIRNHSQECPLAEMNTEPVQHGVAHVVQRRPALPSWTSGQEVKWGLCDFCKHPGWKNGRLLVQTEYGWLCRLCMPKVAQMAMQNASWQQGPWGLVPPGMPIPGGCNPDLAGVMGPWHPSYTVDAWGAGFSAWS
jgi:alkylated DNA repair dioxygenase AlkB